MFLKALYALLGGDDERRNDDYAPAHTDIRHVALTMSDSALMREFDEEDGGDEEMGYSNMDERLADYTSEYLRSHLGRSVTEHADLYANVIVDPGGRGMGIVLLGADHPLVVVLQMYGISQIARVNHASVGDIRIFRSADVDDAALRLWEKFIQFRPPSVNETEETDAERTIDAAEANQCDDQNKPTPNEEGPAQEGV